ncbi:MAG: phytanoyl-CoA dioxygenase family protein [Hyphomicrobiaceae bacterium]
MSSNKVLSSDQVKSFRDNGYVFPVRVMSAEDAAGYRARLETFERAQGSPLKGDQRTKNYLLFTWANEILHHPRILDAVEDLYGPDLMVYTTTNWIKEPNSGSFVSWHQDCTYFGLEPLDNVTVWLALSRADSESGCMRVLPGSHKSGQLPSRLEPVKNNLLSSGQVVEHQFNENDTVEMPLEPGEMSMHHTCTIHGSPGNRSADRRIGICMHFMPASNRPLQKLIDAGSICSTTLVRGRRHHELFPHETPPASDADQAARTAHAAGISNYRNMMLALGNQTPGRFD